MKTKTLFLLSGLFICGLAIAQPNFQNVYLLGFQTAKANIYDGQLKGTARVNNPTLSGVIVNNKGVFHVDVTYLAGFIVKGFKRPGNLEGGVFEAGWGTTFRNKEKSRWAWSGDLIFRSLNSTKLAWDTITKTSKVSGFAVEQVNYTGVGGTIYYIKKFGDRFFMMPRFSMAYGGTSIASVRMAIAKVAVSFGIPITERGWGVSVTFGAYGYKKDLNEQDYGKGASTGANLRFIQFGLANCF